MSKKKLPQNFATGIEYQGVNAQDLLGAQATLESKSNQWATYNQWASAGYQVQKGQHGVGIMAVMDDRDSGKKLVKWYKVFNEAQVAPLEVSEEN